MRRKSGCRFSLGIRSLLEGYADIHIVGEAGNGLKTIMLMEKLHPGVVIMDINMPPDEWD